MGTRCPCPPFTPRARGGRLQPTPTWSRPASLLTPAPRSPAASLSLASTCGDTTRAGLWSCREPFAYVDLWRDYMCRFVVVQRSFRLRRPVETLYTCRFVVVQRAFLWRRPVETQRVQVCGRAESLSLASTCGDTSFISQS